MDDLEGLLDKYGRSGESIVHYVESKKGALICSNKRVFKILKNDPNNIKVDSLFYNNIGSVKQDVEIRQANSGLQYIISASLVLGLTIGLYWHGVPEPVSEFSTLIYGVLGLVTILLGLLGCIMLMAGPKENKTKLVIGTLSGKTLYFKMNEESAIKSEKVIMENVQDKNYDNTRSRR